MKYDVIYEQTNSQKEEEDIYEEISDVSFDVNLIFALPDLTILLKHFRPV